jgi:hypothetical protein
MRIDIPYLQFRPNTIIQYNVAEYTHPKSSCRIMQNRLYENLREHKTYSGMLCPGAKKRLAKAIDFLVDTAQQKTIYNPVSSKMQPFKLNFITLTISAQNNHIKGKEGHKMLLEPFLKWMRDKHKGKVTYLWKAELQKRGQLHYHVVCDVFIHWKQIQYKWNELQQRNGLLEDYHKRYGYHKMPKSTDVHAIYKIKDIAGYLKKEIAKQYQNAKDLGGKIWDCSQNLKGLKYFTTMAYHGKYNYNDTLTQKVKAKEVTEIITEQCRIFKFHKEQPSSILIGDDRFDYNKLITAVREKRSDEIRIKKPPKVDYTEMFQKEFKPVIFRKADTPRRNLDIDIGLFGSS